MIKTEVNSDLRGQSTLTKISAVKGDTDRQIRVYLRDGGKPYPIAAGSYAVLMGKKPYGTAVFNNCRIESNVILYDFTDQTCAVEGSYPVQIKLYGPDQKTITTVPFQIDVYGTEFDAEAAAASADEQTALDDLVNRTRALQLDILHDKETGVLGGESAYDIAVRLGFQGNETEWIDSLRYDHSKEFTAFAEQVRQSVAEASGFTSEAEAQAQESAKQAGLAGTQVTAAKAQAEEAARQAGIAAEQAAAAQNRASSAVGSAADAKAQAEEAARQAGVAEDQAESAKLQAQEAARQKDLAADQVTDAQTQAAKAAGSMEAAKAEADRAKTEADRSIALGLIGVAPGQIPVADQVTIDGVVTKWRSENKPSGGGFSNEPFERVVSYTLDCPAVEVVFSAPKYPKIAGRRQFAVSVELPTAGARAVLAIWLKQADSARFYRTAYIGMGEDGNTCAMIFCDASSGVFLPFSGSGNNPSVNVSPKFGFIGYFSASQHYPTEFFNYTDLKIEFGRELPVGTEINIISRL